MRKWLTLWCGLAFFAMTMSSALASEALIVAARDGHADRVRKLIADGVDVNYRRPGSKTTALMDAANQGYAEIVILLLDAGADPSAAMWDGSVALTFAAQNGQLEAVEVLLARGRPTKAQVQTALHVATRTGHPKTSEALVRAGADVNDADESGMTPLMLAAKWGFAKTAGALLGLGAKVNARDKGGRTPLMWAAWQGHTFVVQTLLDAGADPTLTDGVGFKAFASATTADSIAALLGGHRAKVKETPKLCRPVVGYAMLAPSGGRIEPSAWDVYRRPKDGTAAWIVPHSGARAIKSIVVTTKRNQADGDGWDAKFQPLAKGSVQGAKRSRDATIVWPAGKQTPKLITPRRTDLPWGVHSGIVDAAIDADADGRPEVLSLQFCCKDNSSNDKCQYHCREYWWRDGTAWRKCEASGPA